jgi:hypothetical protein
MFINACLNVRLCSLSSKSRLTKPLAGGDEGMVESRVVEFGVVEGKGCFGGET